MLEAAAPPTASFDHLINSRTLPWAADTYMTPVIVGPGTSPLYDRNSVGGKAWQAGIVVSHGLRPIAVMCIS